MLRVRVDFFSFSRYCSSHTAVLSASSVVKIRR